MPQPVYSFDVTQVGDTHQFTYKKARFGLKQVWGYVLLVVIVSLALTRASGANILFPIALILVFAGIPIGLLNVFRKGGAFSISKDAITVDGQTYDRSHIDQVYIKEPSQPAQTTIIRVGAPSFSSATSQIGADARNAARRQIAKNSWQIGFRYGEKSIRIASGLREDSAEVLYKRVLEVLGNYK